MYIKAVPLSISAALSPISDLTCLDIDSQLSTHLSSFLSFDGNGESKLQKWSSLIGIVTAIVGNILISFALNIQRYAHIRLHKEWQEKQRGSKRSSRSARQDYGTVNGNSGKQNDQNRAGHEASDFDESACSDDDNDDSREEPYIKSPYWWAGIALMTVGEAGNFLAYGFAPASIVSPLGVVALVSNCIIAPIMLKENFRWRDFAGVVVAVAGAVTVVLSANQEDVKLGPHEILDYITTTTFEVYMAITIGLMIVLAYLSPKYGSKTILIDLGLVGLFGGYTALSTKGVASMLSSTLWKAFTTPITYILIAVLIATAVLQVRYVNKALQRFDSTQVIPVQFVMFTISVIIGSAVLYRDFEHADAAMFAKFFGGCVLTFSGVWLITSGRSNDVDYDSTDDESDSHDERHAEIQQQDQESRPRFLDGERSEAMNSPDRSRRSSEVSFAIPCVDVQTQALRRESVPSVILSSSSPYKDHMSEIPWATSRNELLPFHKPNLATTISSPVLDSEARMAIKPSTTHPPLLRSPLSRSESQHDPHTHPNQQQSGPPPPDMLVVRRPVTPRASLSQRILPGPYLSPLGGSLSAVVADTMRRQPVHRRSKPNLRRSRSGAQSRDGLRALSYNDRTAEEEALLGSSLNQTLTGPTFRSYPNRGNTGHDTIIDDGTQRRNVTRARSLSNTLGAFLDVLGRSRHDESGHNHEQEASHVERSNDIGSS